MTLVTLSHKTNEEARNVETDEMVNIGCLPCDSYCNGNPSTGAPIPFTSDAYKSQYFRKFSESGSRWAPSSSPTAAGCSGCVVGQCWGRHPETGVGGSGRIIVAGAAGAGDYRRCWGVLHVIGWWASLGRRCRRPCCRPCSIHYRILVGKYVEWQCR